MEGAPIGLGSLLAPHRGGPITLPRGFLLGSHTTRCSFLLIYVLCCNCFPPSCMHRPCPYGRRPCVGVRGAVPWWGVRACACHFRWQACMQHPRCSRVCGHGVAWRACVPACRACVCGHACMHRPCMLSCRSRARLRCPCGRRPCGFMLRRCWSLRLQAGRGCLVPGLCRFVCRFCHVRYETLLRALRKAKAIRALLRFV